MSAPADSVVTVFSTSATARPGSGAEQRHRARAVDRRKLDRDVAGALLDPGHAAAACGLKRYTRPVVHVRLGYVEVVADQLVVRLLATAERRTFSISRGRAA